MPFGSFVASRRDPVPKKEKPAPKPVAPKPAPAPVAAPAPEPTMSFRDLNADSTKIHVQLVGRTMSQIQEFLCALNENMSNSMHSEGMAFYTTELETITEVVNKKKKLERFCWEFSGNDWCCSATEESGKVYTFSISPSGMQDKTLDLVMHCSTFQGGVDASQQADALWYLADGPVLDAETGYDAYTNYLQDALRGVPAGQNGMAKPACLLVSQIEKYGHFSGVGEHQQLKPAVENLLRNRCRELFTCGDNVNVAIIPVQVYGGMEYSGLDGEGKPILRLSQDGYYQTYIPENCQIPGLYTISKIMEIRGTDYFAESPCGGVKKMIRNHYGKKKADIAWQPDLLREVDRS